MQTSQQLVRSHKRSNYTEPQAVIAAFSAYLLLFYFVQALDSSHTYALLVRVVPIFAKGGKDRLCSDR